MTFSEIERNSYFEDIPEYSVEYQEVSKKNLLETTTNTASFFYNKYSIPLSILKSKSAYGAIVVFLKGKGLSYKQIADLTNRDQRTVWCTYNNSKDKKKNKDNSQDKPIEKQNTRPLHIPDTLVAQDISIPLEILWTRELSVLESIVFYLKNTYNLEFREIADLMGKNYMTIYTVYRRVMTKNE